jgi:hypothetical protein
MSLPGSALDRRAIQRLGSITESLLFYESPQLDAFLTHQTALRTRNSVRI